VARSCNFCPISFGIMISSVDTHKGIGPLPTLKGRALPLKHRATPHCSHPSSSSRSFARTE
jgi:hypothetical protein